MKKMRINGAPVSIDQRPKPLPTCHLPSRLRREVHELVDKEAQAHVEGRA